MTTPLTSAKHKTPPPPFSAPPDQATTQSDQAALGALAVGARSRWPRLWARTQFVVCLVLTGSVLAYLLWTPETGAPTAVDDQRSAPGEAVRLAGPKCVRIQPDCPLCRKLQVVAVKPVQITAPVLNVTGVVAASLRPGNGKGSDYWQFNSSELLTAFTDWQKATADITFAETQLTAIRQLADTRVSAQEKLVQRMRKLVEAGTDTQKDLAAAEADLIQAQIQGRKEVHEAETAMRLARRSEAALARQLQQAGLEPEMLQSAALDLDVVMADVPEGLMSRVKINQGCEARFFGFPDQVFAGKVKAIAPVLSKERRSLRVLFAIRDPRDQLRPGMFADIGLGTDARDALLIPPEAVVHVGRADYVLVGNGNGDWRVTEVSVGELHDAAVEILGGLHAGQQVAGKGAILLKPYIIQAVQTRGSTHVLQTASSEGERR
jgi:cobalt-zinc-cadmium efflux system membrane fusion protein